MRLLPKQNNAVYYLKDKVTTEILFGGAAGGGKSKLGCLWLIEMCQTCPGTRWVMARKVLKALKETTLNTFFETSKELGLNDQWEYKQQQGLIQWKNGSQILLKELRLKPTDPNFDELGSLEITGAFVDETAQICIKAWTVLKSRIRYKLDEFDLIPKMLGSCNPSKNWNYKLFYKAKKNKSIAPYRAFVQSLPTDNPFLPESYIDSLNQMDETSKQRLLFGNWEYDNDAATIIGYDAIMNYWNPKHIEAGDEVFLTIDVARKGKDKTVFRVWKGWLCVKRYEMAISLIPEIIAKAHKIQSAFKIKNSNTIADEDGVGGGVVDGLGCKGFINNSSALYDAESKDGDINYTNLKNQCSIRMAKRIEDGTIGEICDDPEVIEKTSEEMEQVKFSDIDRDGKQSILSKDKVKAVIGRSPDDWDVIMMREWFSLRVVHKSF